MTNILYVSWFVLSELYIKMHRFKGAYSIINNSLIQLEKSSNANEYLLMLFKYNMYKVMMYKNITDVADVCLKHAQYISSKYNINYNFDTNPEHYIAEDADEEKPNEANENEEPANTDNPESEG